MWSERNLLDSLLWEAAVDNMGIYPKSITQDGKETPRSEWQDGWNAAVFDVADKHEKMCKWVVESLDKEHQQMLVSLLDGDAEPIFVRANADAVQLFIQCGDTFAYACADSEEFTVDALPVIHRLYKAHGHYGLVAWIARKRQQEPVKEYKVSKGYLMAKADLP